MLFTKQLTLCVLLLSTLYIDLFCQNTFQLTTSQLDHTFELQEQMTFNIKATKSGQATFSIRQSALGTPLKEGTVQLQAGQIHRINFTLEYPGTVWFEVKMNNETDFTSATFSPFKIKPKEVEPTDFDIFWEQEKRKLAQVPIDEKVNIHQENEYSTTYQVSLGMIDNRRVYGYICIPKGTGNYPAVLSLPSFGAAPNLVKPLPELAERVGALSMSISIHNAPPNQQIINPYQPDDPSQRDNNYFRYAILASLRAIDYLESRTDFSGKLAVTGVSQGGGLAIMTAGLTEKVNLLAFSNPTHTEHQGIRYNIASGFPYYLEQLRVNVPSDLERFQATAEAVKYYDAVYFAKRFKGTTLGIIGYNDQICPAATTLAAFNQLSGKKILFHGTRLGHHHPIEYWKGQQDAFRRFLNPDSSPPFPYARKTQGYYIDIKVPSDIQTKQEALFQGIALRNEDTLNQNILWEKISGAGTVTFQYNNQLMTTATFSDTGIYRLRLKAEDRSMLNSSGNFYTLIEEIEVRVRAVEKEEVFIIECPEDIFLSTPTEAMIVEWESPRIITNTCDDVGFNFRQVHGMISGSSFPIGISTIEYEISNTCGLIETCSFDIIIEQEVPEAFGITCPDDIYASVPILGETIIIEWEKPKVHVPCKGGYTLQRLQGVPSGSRFTLGKATIVYLLTDECGNQASCSFDIVVGFGNGQNRPNIATISPNPVHEVFSLNLSKKGKSTFVIKDVLGRIILQKVLLPNTILQEFPIGTWAKGIYFWEVWTNRRLVESGKLIKE